MTLEQTGLSVEQVMSVRDRPLEAAYETHDVGMAMLTARLQTHGLLYEDHGDDARHADEVLYGDGPDLAVYRIPDHIERNADGLGSQFIDTETGQFVPPTQARELVCYIEVKTKESPEWFGRCNLRHFREYVQFTRETDVPVYIWFAYLDTETEQLHRDAFIEVRDTNQISEDSVDISDSEVVFSCEDVQQIDEELRYVEGTDIVSIHDDDLIVNFIPSVHGNSVVELNNKEFRNFSHVLNSI